MGLIMIVRFSIKFIMSFYQTSAMEFYPVSINSIGVGMGGVFAAVGMGCSEVLITSLMEVGMNFFLIVSLLLIILLVFYNFLPETLGKEKRDQIEEIGEEK